eukprot:32655_1
MIRYIGKPHFAKDERIGIELDKWSAKGHDGRVGKFRYFKTKYGYGTFVTQYAIIEKIKPHSIDIPSLQFSIGDYVLIKENRKGIIKYIGKTRIVRGTLVGIELDEKSPAGHDGIFGGTKYFKCPQGHGIFVRLIDVIKVLKSMKDCEKKKQMFETIDDNIEIYDIIQQISNDDNASVSSVIVHEKDIGESQIADYGSYRQYETKYEEKQEEQEVVMEIGDYVKLQNGTIGRIRFIGNTDFAKGEIIGLEMDIWDSDAHNGTKNGKRYYQCKQGHGLWTRRQKIKQCLKIPDNVNIKTLIHDTFNNVDKRNIMKDNNQQHALEQLVESKTEKFENIVNVEKINKSLKTDLIENTETFIGDTEMQKFRQLSLISRCLKNYGNILFITKQYNKTIHYCINALRIANSEELKIECYQRIAFALERLNNFNQAIVYAQNAFHINSNDANTLQQLGYYYFMVNEYYKSMTYCKKLLQTKEFNQFDHKDKIYFIMAKNLTHLGDFETALKYAINAVITYQKQYQFTEKHSNLIRKAWEETDSENTGCLNQLLLKSVLKLLNIDSDIVEQNKFKLFKWIDIKHCGTVNVKQFELWITTSKGTLQEYEIQQQIFNCINETVTNNNKQQQQVDTFMLLTGIESVDEAITYLGTNNWNLELAEKIYCNTLSDHDNDEEKKYDYNKDDIKTWQCEKCTLQNEPDALICDACSAPKAISANDNELFKQDDVKSDKIINRKCGICGNDDTFFLIVCKGCERPVHQHCYNIALNKIKSVDNWYCETCEFKRFILNKTLINKLRQIYKNGETYTVSKLIDDERKDNRFDNAIIPLCVLKNVNTTYDTFFNGKSLPICSLCGQFDGFYKLSCNKWECMKCTVKIPIEVKGCGFTLTRSITMFSGCYLDEYDHNDEKYNEYDSNNEKSIENEIKSINLTDNDRIYEENNNETWKCDKCAFENDKNVNICGDCLSQPDELDVNLYEIKVDFKHEPLTEYQYLIEQIKAKMYFM